MFDANERTLHVIECNMRSDGMTIYGVLLDHGMYHCV